MKEKVQEPKSSMEFEADRIAALEAQVARLQCGKPDFDKHNGLDVKTKTDAIQVVEQRGNIQVDLRQGRVTILKSLEFDLRTTKEEPTAVFSDPCQAQAICKDLAEVANIFGCSVLIEGHTRGGEGEFWQKLAENRALAVAG